jgi:hypothetical protein
MPALIVAIFMVPVLMAWWFAPILAAWHRQPLGKSLFFSFVACSMNWRPFVVYGRRSSCVRGASEGSCHGRLA